MKKVKKTKKKNEEKKICRQKTSLQNFLRKLISLNLQLPGNIYCDNGKI